MGKNNVFNKWYGDNWIHMQKKKTWILTSHYTQKFTQNES